MAVGTDAGRGFAADQTDQPYPEGAIRGRRAQLGAGELHLAARSRVEVRPVRLVRLVRGWARTILTGLTGRAAAAEAAVSAPRWWWSPLRAAAPATRLPRLFALTRPPRQASARALSADRTDAAGSTGASRPPPSNRCNPCPAPVRR